MTTPITVAILNPKTRDEGITQYIINYPFIIYSFKIRSKNIATYGINSINNYQKPSILIYCINWENTTIFFIQRPLNLPCPTIYLIKKDEIINVLSWIKLKTPIDFFTFYHNWIRIQVRLKTFFISFHAVLQLPHSSCLCIKLNKYPHILRGKKFITLNIICLYNIIRHPFSYCSFSYIFMISSRY